MRIGFLQFRPEFGRPGANLDRIGALVGGVTADLLVLPELATTGYNFTGRAELEALAEPVPGGPASERLAALAARLQGWLAVGLAEREGDAVYNSAALFGPAGWAGTYRKIHLYDREKLVFDPGNRGFPVFELDRPYRPRVGLMVCFDWRYPEAARRLALAGADILAHPSNLVMRYCQAAMITRCLENRVYAVTANRTGEEDRGGHRIGFTGQSQVVDPSGDVLVSADTVEDRLALVEIDLEEARRKSINARNDLFADRRPEFYG